MLVINNLDPKSKLFKGIDLTLPDKGLVFICGKKESSLKKLVEYIGGFAYSDKLFVALDGLVLNKQTAADYRHKYMGYISQNSQHIEGLTVAENILTSCYLIEDQLTEEYLDSVLAKCNLLEVKNTLVEDLNELQLHLVDFARAIIKDPKVLLVNNPISRLTDEEQTVIWNLCKELSKEYLVIVVNAIHGVAKNLADILVSIEARENNHVVTNYITTTTYHELEDYYKEQTFEKPNKLSCKRVDKLSWNLFKQAKLLIFTLILGLSIFMVSMSATSDQHLKFAESLDSYKVTSLVLTRNTEKDDYTIPEEQIKKYEGISKDITIDWGYYYRNNIVTSGKFTAHLNNYSKIVAQNKGVEFNEEQLYFEYPNAMFEVKDSAKKSFKFVAGSWSNQTKGIYVSKSFAQSYLDYFNTYAKKYADFKNGLGTFQSDAKSAFEEYYNVYGYETISSLKELVGKHLYLGYSAKYKDLEIAGIFEDNSYLDSIVFTSKYTFPQNEGTTVENFQDGYSIGIATLSKDVKVNTKFLKECASIIENEKQFIYAASDLDYFYTPILTKINTVPKVLNVISIIFVVLAIAASAILSYIQLNTYIKEIALARTYGIKKPQISRVSNVYLVKTLIISLISSIVFANLVCLIINAIIRLRFVTEGTLDIILSVIFGGKHAFIPFMMFTIPWYIYLICLGACVIYGFIFSIMARKMLQKKDMFLY